MKLGVELHFDASHSIPAHEGRCKNIHGHTYTVEVVIEGKVEKKSHMIIDYFILKKIVAEVLEKLDHEYLNDIIGYATSERIAQHIYKEVKKKLKSYNAELISVQLWEGLGKWVKVEKGDEY